MDSEFDWKPLALALIIISGALGGLFVMAELNNMQLKNAEVTINLKIDYGNGTVESETITTTNYTPMGVLEAVVGNENIQATYYEGMGWLVDGINGVKNGADVPDLNDTDQRWWQYYVNDTLGPVSADRFALQEGDLLEWKFEIPSWG
jgi:hypothetical protein